MDERDRGESSGAGPGRPRRGGRPRAGEAQARRDKVLDAAFSLLVERGYESMTTLAVAQRAGASKETLYAWYGSKEGLVVALIRRNAAEANRRVERALAGDGSPHEVLGGFGAALVRLLTSEQSIALNRAAMTSPALARVLLDEGRHRTGPLVERYLGDLVADDVLRPIDPREAFGLLYGLLVQDLQIRALLGERALAEDEVAEHAETAVGRFLALLAPGGPFPAGPAEAP